MRADGVGLDEESVVPEVAAQHDGVAAVVERLKGHPLFAHVTLTRSERSPIAALVTDLLEGVEL